MERRYPEAPIPAVGAVVVKDGHILLVMRGKEPGYGQWSIPGGAIRVGETLEKAVIREIQEETGLVVEPVCFIGAFDRIVQDEKGQILYHYVLLDFLCQCRSGKAKASSDVMKVRWVQDTEIGSYRLARDTEDVIRKGLEMTKGNIKCQGSKLK